MLAAFGARDGPVDRPFDSLGHYSTQAGKAGLRTVLHGPTQIGFCGFIFSRSGILKAAPALQEL